MKIGIGIDTGGTYTDAVLYDFEKKAILGSAKALTTKEDLLVGILGALDALPGELAMQTELVSLSTTLATNACVEDKGGSAKLIFFGGDRKIIDELGGKYGLPPSDEMYIQECLTRFSGEVEQEPDWALFERSTAHGFEGYDGVGILEMNAMRNGAIVEKTAKKLFEDTHDIPAVCGHELFSELNCLQRASSTLLNAQLFPVIRAFLKAIKAAMEQRGISAPVVIMRSNGSLMSEEFAAAHPVETLLCGPAASVAGGMQLARQPNCIIVDIGGTTTDIALVKDGLPVSVLDGVRIGRWKTFVDGLYVKTVGLGGDSAIHYDDGALVLEEHRVVPVCVAAQRYPSLTESLRALVDSNRKHTMFIHEHYMLVKGIEDNPRYSEQEKAFCRALEDGPLGLREAPEAIGTDMYNFSTARLLKEGVVQMCGLTPTDIMHIQGDFSRYSGEAALLAARFVAHNLGVTVEALCELVYDEVRRKLYRNIVTVMLENKNPRHAKNGIAPDIEGFIDESFDAARTGNRDGLISMMFRTDFTLVGIGAPTNIFLNDVAEMLGTTAVIPEHFEVANALGAIVGNVCVAHAVEIRPNHDSDGNTGFTVFGNDEIRKFEDIEEAEAFALDEARQGALAEAYKQGAQGDVSLTFSTTVDEAPALNCTVYLGTSVVAYAVGGIGF